MNGYVKNKTPYWRHAMKRSVGPGQQIPLDELFEQYGKKYEIQPGKPFVDWLCNVKLRDLSIWEVSYEESQNQTPEVEQVVKQVSEQVAEETVKKEVKPVKKERRSRQKDIQKEMDIPSQVRPFTKKDMTVKDVVTMSVREARTELKKITDINMLKYALHEARQLAGKDSLAILLRRRVQELEITRR